MNISSIIVFLVNFKSATEVSNWNYLFNFNDFRNRSGNGLQKKLSAREKKEVNKQFENFVIVMKEKQKWKLSVFFLEGKFKLASK